MGEYLKSSSKTVIKVFKELEKAKLIKQENQGKGKAYKIYVVDIYSEDEQKEKLHITNEKNTNKVLEFLQPNNIDKKYKQQYKTKNCDYKSDGDVKWEKKKQEKKEEKVEGKSR